MKELENKISTTVQVNRPTLLSIRYSITCVIESSTLIKGEVLENNYKWVNH